MLLINGLKLLGAGGATNLASMASSLKMIAGIGLVTVGIAFAYDALTKEGVQWKSDISSWIALAAGGFLIGNLPGLIIGFTAGALITFFDVALAGVDTFKRAGVESGKTALDSFWQGVYDSTGFKNPLSEGLINNKMTAYDSEQNVWTDLGSGEQVVDGVNQKLATTNELLAASLLSNTTTEQITILGTAITSNLIGNETVELFSID